MKIKWTLKRVIKEIISIVLILFIGSNLMSYIRKPALINEHLPQNSLILLDGKPYVFPKNKPVLIHFWATWCHVCNLEVSTIEQLSNEYEVLTVVVNSGDNQSIEKYMEKEELSFNVLNDNDGVFSRQFNVNVFPTSFIYDAKGKLYNTEVGYTTLVGFIARMKLAI